MGAVMFQGIKGLDAPLAYGANVSIGVKNDRGVPIERDRFHILSLGYEDIGDGKGWRKKRHTYHPAFAQFNSAPPSKRKTMRGNLVFATIDDGFPHTLAAQQLKGGNGAVPGGGTWETPPNSMPACTGDGETARRFMGIVDGSPVFDEIPCLNDSCFFRNTTPACCKPIGRLFFRPVWRQDWPSMIMRFSTRSWNTVKNIKGMMRSVDEVASGLGLLPNQWSYTGLPFEMEVTEKVQPDKGRKFPVVVFAPGDVVTFLTGQVSTRRDFIAAPSIPMLTSGESDNPVAGEINDAVDAIVITEPGQLPARTDASGPKVEHADPYAVVEARATELNLPAGSIERACAKAGAVVPVDLVPIQLPMALAALGEIAHENSEAYAIDRALDRAMDIEAAGGEG